MMKKTPGLSFLLLPLLLTGACGNPGAADTGTVTIGTGGSAAPLDPPSGSQPPSFSPLPCLPGAHPPVGDVLRHINSAGGVRWYALHVPSSYAGKPVPLVLNYHGFTSDPFQEALLTKMNPAADQRGVIVAYPAGLGHSWNAGKCCGNSLALHIDDVRFTRDVIDAVSGEYCVDSHRVYATGMSNGGFMSHRLACELSDRIAAVAPVAGVLGLASCTPPRKVPVLHFHGTGDPLVPYNGSPLLGFPSVPVTYAGWTQREGCGGPEVTLFNRGDSRCVGHSGCGQGSEAILCTVTGGGHTWPGGLDVPLLGITTHDMNATDMMLDFFARHPLP